MIKNHAYQVLFITSVVDQYGDQVSLVKLRNPAGEALWNGDWSTDSSRWSIEIKKKLDFQKHDQKKGTFWMEYDDFNKYFRDINIC